MYQPDGHAIECCVPLRKQKYWYGLVSILTNTQWSAVARSVEYQTANQAVRVQIPANTNEFLLSVFLAPDGSEPT